MQETAPPSYFVTQNLQLSAMAVMVNGNFQQSLTLKISDIYIFSGLSEDHISASTFSSSVRHKIMDNTIKILFTIPASIAARSMFTLTLTPKDTCEGTQHQWTIPIEDAGIPLQPRSSPGNGEDSGIPDTPDDPFLGVVALRLHLLAPHSHRHLRHCLLGWISRRVPQFLQGDREPLSTLTTTIQHGWCIPYLVALLFLCSHIWASGSLMGGTSLPKAWSSACFGTTGKIHIDIFQFILTTP